MSGRYFFLDRVDALHAVGYGGERALQITSLFACFHHRHEELREYMGFFLNAFMQGRAACARN